MRNYLLFFSPDNNNKKKTQKERRVTFYGYNGCKEILHHCYSYESEFLRLFIISKVLLISIKKSLNALF